MSYIYIDCGECEYGTENFNDLVQHVTTVHGYTPEEATEYSNLWAADALERQEVDNIYRGDFYNQHGFDPNDPPADQDDF